MFDLPCIDPDLWEKHWKLFRNA